MAATAPSTGCHPSRLEVLVLKGKKGNDMEAANKRMEREKDSPKQKRKNVKKWLPNLSNIFSPYFLHMFIPQSSLASRFRYDEILHVALADE